MHIDEIYTAILSGDVDDHFDRIRHAIKERQRVMGTQRFSELQVGDEVRISATGLRPRYINGAIGTIAEKRLTKITVQLPDDLDHEHDPYGKWAGKRAILDAHNLEKV